MVGVEFNALKRTNAFLPECVPQVGDAPPIETHNFGDCVVGEKNVVANENPVEIDGISPHGPATSEPVFSIDDADGPAQRLVYSIDDFLEIRVKLKPQFRL